jgi:beta-N-acetylhexosaminidase
MTIRTMRKLIILALTAVSFSGFSQKKPDFLTQTNEKWVDSVFNTLTIDDKVGQILMPRGNYSGKGYEPEKLKGWVRDYKLGGIVFFAGQPTVQAQIANELQSLSKVPMMVGVDMEWGLAMRLDSTVRFPFQMTLGAMQGGDDLLYRMGVEVGKQSKRMGIHVNYAPVVDINNNPKNPVINFRSFGEDKLNVANKSMAYMRGMQSQRLLTSAKHFPGHGDTGVDSHYDLPVISHDKQHLKDFELYPFQYLINNGLSGVMTAHLNIPAFEPKANLASTFSSKIVGDLLRKEMGFEGLTFTDAMDMQGAVKNYKPGEAHVEAFLAGNDILETFEDVPTAFNALKAAVESKKIPMKLLDETVRKILKAKAWAGLDNYKPVKIEGLIEDLNTIESDFLNRTFAEKSLVALADKELPVKNLRQNTLVVSLGAEGKTHFQNMAENYTTTVSASLNKNSNLEELKGKFTADQNVIVGLHLGNNRPGANYGFEPYMQTALDEIVKRNHVILVVFGNPYSLDKIQNIAQFSSVILANQSTKYIEEAAAMAVFGGIEMNGRLPVTVNEMYKVGAGVWVPKFGRLAYGTPEMVGLDSRILEARLDSVMQLGIKEKAYPGAVLEVAKDGRVIYQKPFGFHTYEAADAFQGDLTSGKAFERTNQAETMDSKSFSTSFQKALVSGEQVKGAVNVSDLYDLASITKISTSALAVMQLMSEGKFDLDKTFGQYYPEFKNSNKANLTFRDMLTHRSGLKAWIPFWMDCIDSVATIKRAVELHPELKELCVKNVKPKTFWDKLFNRKPKYTVDYEKSLAQNKSLWTKSLSTETITWLPGIFSNVKSDKYNVEIADTLFMNEDRMKFIFKQIEESPVKPEQGYVYSDLHYYAYPIFMEKLTGKKWEDYLKETYTALGANTLTYNPRRFYGLDKIVPTERDTLFRKTQIHGRVHDEGAGMLNGISGHAGLFGNANDLTKLMQMYLQNGMYGGQQFIKPEVLKEVTSYQFPYEGSRRGIAFDKLDFNKKIANGPQKSSPESYGHSGYTGTFTWVDPKYNLVYVFLSNRVYPTRDNNKISTFNLRTAVGDELIKTIEGK